MNEHGVKALVRGLLYGVGYGLGWYLSTTYIAPKITDKVNELQVRRQQYVEPEFVNKRNF